MPPAFEGAKERADRVHVGRLDAGARARALALTPLWRRARARAYRRSEADRSTPRLLSASLLARCTRARRSLTRCLPAHAVLGRCVPHSAGVPRREEAVLRTQQERGCVGIAAQQWPRRRGRADRDKMRRIASARRPLSDVAVAARRRRFPARDRSVAPPPEAASTHQSAAPLLVSMWRDAAVGLCLRVSLPAAMVNTTAEHSGAILEMSVGRRRLSVLPRPTLGGEVGAAAGSSTGARGCAPSLADASVDGIVALVGGGQAAEL